MPQRSRNRPPLPHAPLDFAYPLKVRPAGLEGDEIVREVSPDWAPYLVTVLHLACAAADGVLPDRASLLRWEEAVAAAELPAQLGDPLDIFAEALRRRRLPPDVLATVCTALSQWADQIEAEGTALRFAEAAALVHPTDPHLAWVAGRLLRDRGHLREAEVWLQRALRVAVWNGDSETQDLALNSLGNLFRQRGSFRQALRYLERALRIARTVSKERRGAVTHDLFGVFMLTGQHERAEAFAYSALKFYGPTHLRLPVLARDIAQLWMRQGRFQIAQRVLKSLFAVSTSDEERLMLYSSLARAAGGCSDRDGFEAAWTASWHIIRTIVPRRLVRGAVLVELGRGAASLGQWGRAEEVLGMAIDYAREQSAFDDVADAESVLDMVRRERRTDRYPRASEAEAAGFADALVESIARVGLVHEAL